MPNAVARLVYAADRLCAPPGSGWATGSTGWAPLARDLHTMLYGTVEPRSVRAAWRKSLTGSGVPELAVLGVPYDGGTYGLTGAAAGPLGIRTAAAGRPCDLRRSRVIDLGDVRYLPGLPLDEMLAPDVLKRVRTMRFGDDDSWPVCMLSAHTALVRAAAAAGVRVLSLGGDHSIAASAIDGLSHPRLGLVHVDAHPDLSTGRDGLSLLHSSWLHHLERHQPPVAIVQVAVPDEPVPGWVGGRLTRISREVLDADVQDAGTRIVDALRRGGAEAGYLSIDIDVVDAAEAPATGLPASPGLASSTVVELVEAIGRRIPLVGADLVEVAPPLAGTRSWSDDTTCMTATRIARALARAIVHGPTPMKGWGSGDRG